MEERFVELYGLQKYTYLIKKYPTYPFEEIVEKAFGKYLDMVHAGSPSMVSIVVGTKRFCFSTSAESFSIPLGSTSKCIHWPVEPKTGDNIFSLMRKYILTGTIDPKNIALEKVFDKLEDYRYISNVLNHANHFRGSKPNSRVEKKLNKLGLFYNEPLGVWRDH